MAKKKTTKKEEEVKDTKSDFDFESYLADLEIPDMLKVGFKYYIETNNIPVKSENDLTKELTKFKQK